MPNHDIIVIGASAGGVEALQEVISSLSPNLSAAVFVVLHLYPRSESFLPQILSRSGPLVAMHPEDGQAIENGKIYIAPPDHHLVLEKDHMHVSVGPKEQHQRPCINVTFRSAALNYGERVVGVVLTGQLDDGTAGLFEIKRRGGLAIVQNPEEASFPSMPLSALREVEVDYTLPLGEIGPHLNRLAAERSSKQHVRGGNQNMPSTLTDITCPDCRGTIWENQDGRFLQYHCRVGHVFSPKTMLAEQFASQEKLLYGAIVALEEGAALAERLAGKLGPEVRDKLQGEARERLQQAQMVREILKNRRTFSLD
jgi:two-component system, chemotaxis family, protein-glutamate methylesterase/glutaminase